jgi:hypothetical protein
LSPARVGGGLEAAAGEVGRRGGSEAAGVHGSTVGAELETEGGISVGKCRGEGRSARETRERQRPRREIPT